MGEKKSYQGIPTNQEKYFPDKIEKILTKNPKIKKWEKFMRKRNKFLKNQHELTIKILENNPILIGIYEKVEGISNLETQFEEKHGETDIIFTNPYRAFYGEYKCEDSIKNRNDAIRQLERTKNHIPKKYQRNLTTLLYIYKNFKVDEWVPEEGWKEWRTIPIKFKK